METPNRQSFLYLRREKRRRFVAQSSGALLASAPSGRFGSPLHRSAAKCSVGLPYAPRLLTLRLPFGPNPLTNAYTPTIRQATCVCLVSIQLFQLAYTRIVTSLSGSDGSVQFSYAME